jgi:hypothetical protein
LLLFRCEGEASRGFRRPFAAGSVQKQQNASKTCRSRPVGFAAFAAFQA